MSSEPMALNARGLGKTYQLHATPWRKLLQLLLGTTALNSRPFAALQDVSFQVQRGESVGIIGVNGSGKSTLLQIIAGTLSPSAGQVKVQGRVAALLELGAGFNPDLTGLENLRMGSLLHGIQEAQLVGLLERMVAFADIGEFIDQPVKTYSSGMFVRVAFALIAHVQADILIVDEALAVGDAAFTQKCMRFLHDFMRNGTLIFVSHDIASMRALCTKTIWLERGRVRMMGEPKVVGDAYLEHCYAKQQDVTRVAHDKPQTAELAAAKPPAPLDSAHPSDGQSLAGKQDFRLNISLNPLQMLSAPRFDMSGFGAGKARITQVTLQDEQGQTLHQSSGGQRVSLRIQAQLEVDLNDLVLGYFVRNKLGLNIFGDNTYLAYSQAPVSSRAGDVIAAKFCFVMPFLPQGEYSVCAAIATGNNLEHEQQHWINEALIIRSLDNYVHADVLALPSIGMSIEKVTSI
jgi:lipopolysaccharide transport system ATP-binding protein